MIPISISDASRSRHVAVILGWIQIGLAVAAAPALVFGESIQIAVILALSLITQAGTGLSTLFAAWAARDTDRLTPDD